MLPAPILDDVLAVLRDEDHYEEYDWAEDVLLSLGSEDVSFLPVLMTCLRDKECRGRFWILLALEKISPNDTAVFAAITECSRDSDEHVRGEAIRYLGQHGTMNTALAVFALAKAARLRPSEDYVSNAVKAFAALVHLVGWNGAWSALRRKDELAE